MGQNCEMKMENEAVEMAAKQSNKKKTNGTLESDMVEC